MDAAGLEDLCNNSALRDASPWISQRPHHGHRNAYCLTDRRCAAGVAGGRCARWLWASLITYLLWLFVIDLLLHSDAGSSLRAIAPSSPLLAAAIVAMAIDPRRGRVSHRALGEWSGLAVLATTALALGILHTQPGWQILGRSLTDLTAVNGRLSLFVGNPLPFAGALLGLGFVSLQGWEARGPLSRLLGMSSMLLAICVVALWSQSRGATLAALPLLALALWYLRPRAAGLATAAILLAALAAFMLDVGGLGDIAAASNNRLMQGLAALAGNASADASTWIRLQLYEAGLSAWRDSPILGHGVSQSFWAVLPHLPADFGHRFSHLHNTFVTHAVAGGLTGLAALIAVLLSTFAINRRSQPRLDPEASAWSRDRRYFAWLIFLLATGVGMSSVVLHHDVSANFLGALLVAHLMTQPNTSMP